MDTKSTKEKAVGESREKNKRRLESISLERRERFVTVEKRFLNPSAVYAVPWFLGTWSHTIPFAHKRYLLASECLTVGSVKESPSTVARDWLKMIYGHGPGLRGPAREIIPALFKDRKPKIPHYAKPCEFEYGFYLDIWHCYWQIMLTVGWNPRYLPGKYLLAGSPPIDFPFPESGESRDCLVSCAMHNEIKLKTPPIGEPMHFGKYNPVWNETITVLIRDVLHAVARLAVELGAVYWNTDGCICPNVQIAERVEQMMLDFGLIVRYKAEGPGCVISSGNYRVGEMVTKMSSSARPMAHYGLLDLEYSRWLQQNFAAFAARRFVA